MKVRLYDWDGKALKEVGVLEGNKGIVSALGISPDGSLLAAGDVSENHQIYQGAHSILVGWQGLLVQCYATGG